MLTRSNPPQVGPPTGLYSLVSQAPPGASLTWVAGQTGRQKDGAMAADSVSQTRDAFANLGALIEAVGASPSDIACLRTYLTAGAQEGFYQGRNRVFSEWFPHGDFPVNTLVVITALADPRAMVEVEAVVAVC